MIKGKPFNFKNSLWKDTAHEIDQYFNDVLFNPIVELFKDSGEEVKKIVKNQQPHEVVETQTKANNLYSNILFFLDNAIQNRGEFKNPSINGHSNKIISDTIKETDRTLPIDTKSFIPSESTLRDLANTFDTRLNKYIIDNVDDRLKKMRDMVAGHMDEGGDIASLAKKFGQTYGINKRKAEFLARQETSLLVTETQKNRYQQVGVLQFQWLPSASITKDLYHETLYGTRWSFEEPPVINLQTGEVGLPRQRYNCRCGMRPILNS